MEVPVMADLMLDTIEYYNRNATEFYEGTIGADMSYVMGKFCAYLEAAALGEPSSSNGSDLGTGADQASADQASADQAGATPKTHPIKVLDAGCGSGRDTVAFIKRGYDVAAFDASDKMARMASELTGIDVKCRTFADVDEIGEYDGVWACASLLHVPREEVESAGARLRDSLAPGGVLYMSFKYGDSERMKDGRFFCDMTEAQIDDLLNRLEMKSLETFITGDVREGRSDERWINVIATTV